MLYNELNVLTILSTIKKMKATLSEIIGDDSELIYNIKQSYFNS